MLILASRSPRRSDLLRAEGFDFAVRAMEIDESVQGEESPRDYVRRLAEMKALAVSMHAGEVIVAADTTVALGNEIFGKPRDEEDARWMLERLSGRRHEVYTGVCVRSERMIHTEVECTGVWFDPLDKAVIDGYVRSGEPLDKAGAYAIQGLAEKFIPRIEGSYSNVVGLPIDLVRRMLKEHVNE
jgi:septum formation protein